MPDSPSLAQLRKRIALLKVDYWLRPAECRLGARDALGKPLPWRALDVLRRAGVRREIERAQAEVERSERLDAVVENVRRA